MDNKSITIFSMKLAGYLMQKGFVLIGMEKSTKNKGKNVYFFKNSNEIQHVISDYAVDK